jgi:hypothetical protein
MKDVSRSLIGTFDRVMGEEQAIMELFTAASRDSDGVKQALKGCTLAAAIMKAVCFSRGWIEEVSLQKGEQYSARVLVIKSPSEDPS